MQFNQAKDELDFLFLNVLFLESRSSDEIDLSFTVMIKKVELDFAQELSCIFQNVMICVN